MAPVVDHRYDGNGGNEQRVFIKDARMGWVEGYHRGRQQTHFSRLHPIRLLEDFGRQTWRLGQAGARQLCGKMGLYQRRTRRL